MKPLRVAIVTNVLPHYRAAFYRELFRRSDLEVRVFCQRSLPGMNLELVHDQFRDRVTLVPAITMNREWLNWQWLPFRRLLADFDVVFVPGNVRQLSGVALASLARALKKPVVLWGQAHTANADARTEKVRLAWWRWFDHFLVYTDGEARRLAAHGFAGRYVRGMNNGLDQRRIDAEVATWDPDRLARWRREEGLADRALVLSCARLEPKNEFDLWVRAMADLVARHPALLWCVIGDGQEGERLRSLVEQAGLSSHVRWLGRILEEERLAPWFLSSRLLVHPGAIGLTMIHAFGYGLPVVTHGDPEAHMPEFDAFVPGETGLTFPRGDVAGLAVAVDRGLASLADLARMGSRARAIARETYNVEVMAERLAEIARHAVGSQSSRRSA